MSSEVKPNLLKPRWSKVFSDLRDDKARTLLVVTSIAVGVFAVGMIISAYKILGEDINRSYAAINPPNIVIWTDPFYKDYIRVIETVPGVEGVEWRRVIGIRGRRYDENWQNLSLVGIPNLESIAIGRLETIAGNQIPGKNEVLVSQDFLDNTGFQVGDEIEIELPDGSTHSAVVVWLVTDQTKSRPDPSTYANVFVTIETLESWGVGNYFNQLLITVEGDGSDSEIIANVASEVQDLVERGNREVYQLEENLSNEHPMTDTILAVLGVLGILGGLIMVLSSSLIINMLIALMAQQLRQIGIMKLVGGRSYQILGMYLTLIVVYSLIALVLSVPLGAIAGYELASFVAFLLGAVLQGFRFIPTAIRTQILIAILVPLGAGFFPVIQGTRINVRQAISNDQVSRQPFGQSFLISGARWVRWVSRPVLLSFRNLFRKTGRLLLTIFTLTIAGGVFIAVFNARDSMDIVMDQLLQHFMADVSVDFWHPYRVNLVESDLLKVPGVIGVEGWGSASGDILDWKDEVVTRLSIVAPPQDTQLLTLDFVAGRWLLTGEKNAIVIADSIYKFYPFLQPGDTLTVQITGERKEEWEVVGIFRFVDIFGDPIAYANYEFVAKKTDLPNQALSYRIITDRHGFAYQEEVSRRVDNYLTGRDYFVRRVETGGSLQATASMGINILIIFLLLMAVITAFVGSIGLTGSMSINVLERTREIGVMRTIGAVDLVIAQSVIIESLSIGLITWVLAIGVSFPISNILLEIIGEAMAGSTIKLSFTPFGIFLWLGVVIVLSIFASILPARNATRLTINEVLSYE